VEIGEGGEGAEPRDVIDVGGDEVLEDAFRAGTARADRAAGANGERGECGAAIGGGAADRCRNAAEHVDAGACSDVRCVGETGIVVGLPVVGPCREGDDRVVALTRAGAQLRLIVKRRGRDDGWAVGECHRAGDGRGGVGGRGAVECRHKVWGGADAAGGDKAGSGGGDGSGGDGRWVRRTRVDAGCSW
jgi:hypothetical protein